MKTNVKRVSLGLGVAVLFGPGLPAPAAATGGVPPRPPVSAQGQPQAGPRPQANGSLPVMDADAVEPTLIDGRLKLMDPKAKVTAVGSRQMAPVTAEARSPRQGQGPQVGRVTQASGAGSYLNLVLRVTDGSGAEVVDATEHPGTVVLADNAEGAYIQEVTLGGKTVAVEAIADPFEIRSFPPRGQDPEHGQGHAFSRARSVVIAVRAPGVTLRSAAAADVGFALYRAKEQLHGKLDAGVLEQLKREGKVERSLHTVGRALSNEIAQKGRRVEQ